MRSPASYPNPRLRSWAMPDGVQQAGLWYRGARRAVQVALSHFWNVRVFNRHYEPDEGGAVYVCNHQSYLDPVLMGMALRRPMNYMARESLFRYPAFKGLIGSLNAFPIRRGTADTRALKEAMRRLKSNSQVAVFAEGTRTRDGRLLPFLPGVAVLAQRAAKWTVPVLIDGAFEAWPKTQPLPGPGNIVVRYGEPIPQAEARKHKALDFVAIVREKMIEMQADVRRRVGRPALEYD